MGCLWKTGRYFQIQNLVLPEEQGLYQCVLLIFIHGWKHGTWHLTKHIFKICVAQKAIERVLLGLHLVDHVPNVDSRQCCSKVENVATHVIKLK